MGCLEIIVLAALGCLLLGLFFFAIEVAVLATIGVALCGGFGYLLFGVAGFKVGAIIGLVLGIYWAVAG